MKRDGDLQRGESGRLPVVACRGCVPAGRHGGYGAVLAGRGLDDVALGRSGRCRLWPAQAPARGAVVEYIAWYSSTLGAAAVPDSETTTVTRSRMWL